MSYLHYKMPRFLPTIRAFLLYFTMVLLFHLSLSKFGRLQLHPETEFFKVFISSFIFSLLSFPFLCLLYTYSMTFFPWINVSRSTKEDLIPLQEVSSQITCSPNPLINTSPTTQPSLTNLPPPLSEQDPSILHTVHESRSGDISRPFVFVEVSGPFEGAERPYLFELVEVPQPFELVEVSNLSCSLLSFVYSLNLSPILRFVHRSSSKKLILKTLAFDRTFLLNSSSMVSYLLLVDEFVYI